MPAPRFLSGPISEVADFLSFTFRHPTLYPILSAEYRGYSQRHRFPGDAAIMLLESTCRGKGISGCDFGGMTATAEMFPS